MKMLLHLGSIFSVLLLAIPTASAMPSGPLFVDDANGVLGTINLATQSVTILGNTGLPLTDIAFGSDGTLYGTTTDSLYTLEKNGTPTLVSGYNGAGSGDIVALVGDGTGLLAASHLDTSIYSIGVAPFSITALAGATDVPASGDLAFGPNGALYETGNGGELEKITITDGAITVTDVGNMGITKVYGISTADDGNTYAISGTSVYMVDLDTAKTEFLFDYSGKGLGAAAGTAYFGEGLGLDPVPEPGTWAMLCLGLGGLIFYRRFVSRQA